MSKEEIYEAVREQLAIEFNCRPEDFCGEENVITTPVLHEKRRKFSDKKFFLQMATFGNNTVISADEKIHPWLREWVRGKRGFWLFEQHNFYELEKELRKHGHQMSLTHHMFLPGPEISDMKTDLKIRWLEQGDMEPYYGKEEFSNALCDCFLPERPDVLAVIALDGEKIMGMAGCSADTPTMWQIGIDVLPEYRCRGIGRTLVTLLKDEALRRGAMPYYGTSLSNLGSWKIALSTGFEPAWVECESRERKIRCCEEAD
ncbi:MAG: GNAT family N-acetyltransferase [Lachnospiraceae bacterium]|nr:GNAT family N-acetyltransferase [Lachnospiraceae bacterium]